MSQVMQYEFRLFGPRKGQTVNINGHPFVNGYCSLVQSSENMGACARVLSFYGAYHRGSAEYDAAVKLEEEANGAGEVHPEGEQGKAAEVRSDVRQDGSGPADEDAALGAVDAGTDAGSAGSDPSGDGHEHAGVPVFPEAASAPEPVEPATVADDTIKAAIMKLDPDEASHWVATGGHKGKPKLSAIEEALGKAGMTRDDAEAALPGWSRDRAAAAALEG
jgi:hypothetical protein